MATQKRVIKTDAFEDQMLADIHSDSLKHLRTRAGDISLAADELITDLNAMFWTSEPIMRRESELAKPSLINRSALQAIEGSAEFEELRRYTTYDNFATAMAAGSVGETVVQVLERYKERIEQEQNGNGDEQGDGDTPSPGGMGELAKEIGNEIAQAVGTAVSQQAEERQGEAEAARMFGMEPGELRHLDYDSRRKLADAIKGNRMYRWRHLIGRFRHSARAESARKIEHGRDELYAMALSGNPSEFVASEYVNLSHPHLRRDFIRRVGEGTVLSNKWRGKQKAADGPIVCLIDSSSSMDGEPEAWSKAIALSLQDMARKDGRAFTAIFFAASGNTYRVDGTDFDAALEVGSVWIGGGTDFVDPLNQAMDIITHEIEHQKSDVVLLTDGYAHIDETTIERVTAERAKGLRVFGVNIGYYDTSVTEQICDNVRVISDLSDPSLMADVFRTI
jgi:uncharacterized protein with von Willebrand factor type A (vWA) domain